MTIDIPIERGTRIKFKEERQCYTVRAIGKRYAVCTKPFNAQKTLLYTVIDFELAIRGTENLVFGMGAETDEDCEEMIWRLETPEKWYGNHNRTASEVSHRNRIDLHIVSILPPCKPLSS